MAAYLTVLFACAVCKTEKTVWRPVTDPTVPPKGWLSVGNPAWGTYYDVCSEDCCSKLIEMKRSGEEIQDVRLED